MSNVTLDQKFTRFYGYFDNLDRPYGLLKFVGDPDLPGGFGCDAIFDTTGEWHEDLSLIGEWAAGECWPVTEDEAKEIEKKVVAQTKGRKKAKAEGYDGSRGCFWRDS